MKEDVKALEQQRLALQAGLDSQKTQEERNALGQFATPTSLAVDMLKFAATLLPKSSKIHFLDPAIGTGAFYSALANVFPHDRIANALGFEIDEQYGRTASMLWEEAGLSVQYRDFTRANPSPRFNLVICNPPYVRHHHLENGEKERLRSLLKENLGISMSGLAGLYCYFLGISHSWMAENGIAGWLIPSEFMDVNYGEEVKSYLLDKVTLLRIHRFDPNDVQFADALVSSAVVWFRNSHPPGDLSVRFTFGGSLLGPSLSRDIPVTALREESKWTRFPSKPVRANRTTPKLSDFFRVKRGLATGDNAFFILDADAIASNGLPSQLFRPILPSPRHLETDEILADASGLPVLRRMLFLLDTRLPEGEIEERYPALYRYLQEGKVRGTDQRYLSRHRSPWYAQEDRPPAPILCTYLGRSDSSEAKPFRFILNESRATFANVYLGLYPVANLERMIRRDRGLLRRIWAGLKGITPGELIEEGRVYGGGLHKLEPGELSNVDATMILNILPDYDLPATPNQLALFEGAVGQFKVTKSGGGQ